MNIRRNIINILALMAASAFLFQNCATLFKGSTKYEDFRSREKRGAQIEIIKTDGTKIDGELMAIKQNSMLLIESSSGIGGSIDVSEIKFIKVKESLAGTGIGLGILIGGVAGGYFAYGRPEPNDGIRQFFAGVSAIGGFVVGALAGALVGGVIGSFLHSMDKFPIEGRSQEKIRVYLDELRSKARFPDYQ